MPSKFANQTDLSKMPEAITRKHLTLAVCHHHRRIQGPRLPLNTSCHKQNGRVLIFYDLSWNCPGPTRSGQVKLQPANAQCTASRHATKDKYTTEMEDIHKLGNGYMRALHIITKLSKQGYYIQIGFNQGWCNALPCEVLTVIKRITCATP